MVILQLPELPEISPKRILKVYTHKGLHGLPRDIEVDDVEASDNQRLALLGDAVLQLVVTQILMREYPFHRVGPLSKFRSTYILVDKLAEWARAYGMHTQLQCHYSAIHNVRGSVREQASVFQAYVGAVFEEAQGDLRPIDNWISMLLRPEVSDVITAKAQEAGIDGSSSASQLPLPGSPPMSPTSSQYSNFSNATTVRPPHDPPPYGNTRPSTPDPSQKQKSPEPGSRAGSSSQPLGSPPPAVPPPKATPQSPGTTLMRLHEKCTKNRKFPTWETGSEGPPHMLSWTATVKIDGQVAGKGTGSSKQAAKEVAAQEAMDSLGWNT